MSWYDTFPNTKINYYLVDMSMILAPLIWFYVRSITETDFKLSLKHMSHFLPWLVFFILKVVILSMDSADVNFDSAQNGQYMVNIQWKYIDPFEGFFSILQMIIYLVIAFQAYISYRRKVQNFFSNTYKAELNWLRNFLLIYIILYAFNSIQTIINELIIDLSWRQEWWYHLFSAILIIYIGVKGYFSGATKLKELGFDQSSSIQSNTRVSQTNGSDNVSVKILERKALVENYFNEHKPYLNPDLTLVSLAKELQTSREDLSQTINTGFGQKFNDFINTYRIEAIKKMMADGKHSHLSLLGMALDCGFNSKATFNRVFKNMTGQSPSDYLKSI